MTAAPSGSTRIRGLVFAHPGWARIGRAYFALQALAGGVWWIGVFTLPELREATLGAADPVLLAALDVPLFVVGSVCAAAGLRWARHGVVLWTLLVTALLMVGAALSGRAGWGALLMIAASLGSASSWLLIEYARIPADRVLIGPLASRVARSADPTSQLLRTIAQLAVFWLLFLAALPLGIAWLEARWQLGAAWPVPVRVVGLPLLLVASALGIWAAVAMSTTGDGTPLPSATARKLVVAGPYRFVRNPMALAGIAQAAGVGLMLGSWLVIAYALCGSAYWNWLVRPLEEAELEVRLGAAYREYRRRVRCWWPRFPAR